MQTNLFLTYASYDNIGLLNLILYSQVILSKLEVYNDLLSVRKFYIYSATIFLGNDNTKKGMQKINKLSIKMDILASSGFNDTFMYFKLNPPFMRYVTKSAL